MLYFLLKPLCVIAFAIFFRFRGYRADRVPTEGGFILASNHQSFLDPVLLGLGLRRQIGFVARSTLFKNPLFSALIRALGAVPIERDKGDMGALRSVKDALRSGRILVMFPEGTRTRDGTVGRCKAGAAISARAARAPIVFAAIDGAHDAWPKHGKLPRLFTTVRVVYGEPVTYGRGTDHRTVGGDMRARLEGLLEEVRDLSRS